MQEKTIAEQEIIAMHTVAQRLAQGFGKVGINEPDDIAQQALTKVLKSPPASNRPWHNWLYKVVVSTVSDAGRVYKREKKYLCTFDFEEPTAGRVCEATDDERISRYTVNQQFADDVEVDLMPRLKNVLATLSKAHRQVLLLYAEGYEYQEIAEMTKTNIGTVRSRLHNARKRAQSLLEGYV